MTATWAARSPSASATRPPSTPCPAPAAEPEPAPLRSGAKCANSGGPTAGSLASSSQRRTATASRAYGSASNAAACSGVIGPPCRARVRTDSGDSRPKYPGSVAHRYRLAATCSRTGSVTAVAEPLAQPPRLPRCRAGRHPGRPPRSRCPTSCSRAAATSGGGRPGRLGQRAGLAHVLADGHRLAQVVPRPRPGEQLPDASIPVTDSSSRFSTASVLARPSRSA